MVWIITLIGAIFAPEEWLMTYYDIDKVFTKKGIYWIGFSIIFFSLGCILASLKNPYRFRDKNFIEKNYIYINKSVIAAKNMSYVIFFILIIWTIIVIEKIGGISPFLYELYHNWHFIRILWPEQKLFIGARLLYSVFIGLVIFSFAGLGLMGRKEYIIKNKKKINRNLKLILLISLICLFILPLMVSQRLLFATALIGGITSYLIISRKKINIKIFFLCGILLFGLWTAQELIRIGFNGSLFEAISYSIKRFFFYCGNNISNISSGVSSSLSKTYGLLSFEFIFRFIFLDNIIKETFLTSYYLDVINIKGGGTWTGIGTPFMDFGWFGLFVILFWGFISKKIFIKSKNSFLFAQIYGLIAASIVLSPQVQLWSSPEFWINIILIIILNNYIKKKIRVVPCF